ncbi:DUF2189 domain-containing protein [Albidovulum sediminicola]|uniref:DUF2189 domain-containing protein n=1 Tax=Albidovulum sediminicola TaxID=2984331 RepID=A0ABT2YZI2_9RHOB|nr:DUF2189 domain-containing protein [Defluviimonas sp. WL0075]MCV2864230.1 DUF2189 domain-containing protein [Defluviimonas sp. WL0075]
MTDATTGPDPLPEIRTASMADIAQVLGAGVRDFLRAPLFGLFFSAVYVAGGMILWRVYSAAGQEWWIAPLSVGFPLIGPFAAVGLYEVSRRLEAGQKPVWAEVLGVVFAQKDRQIPAIAAVIIVFFLFWVFVAHALFALFVGLRAFSGSMSLFEIFLEGNGPIMLLIGTSVGAAFSAVLFSISVVGLPLLLEREVDFVTAMIHSVQATLANLPVMMVWGAVIVVTLFLGMLPMFLGMFVVLPVLGHASWHMYRRLVATG